MNQRKLSLAILTLLFGMSLLTGCSGDCMWVVDGEVWIDGNGNHQWDAGEPPLPGVQIFFYGIPRSYWVHEEMEAVSDSNGRLTVSPWTAGCPKEEAKLLVVAEVPEGYWVPEPRVILEGLGPDVVQFGFVPVDK